MRRATEPPGPARPAAEEDGQATALDDAAALVFTADCLPVMLVAEGAVATLHGGWRGLAGGIVAEGVAALRELGADGPVAAAIGPGCARLLLRGRRGGPRAFAAYDARGASATSTSRPSPRAQLEAAGVDAVHDVGLCTMCGDPELFFSHRRDRGVTGRQAGVVWRA